MAVDGVRGGLSFRERGAPTYRALASAGGSRQHCSQFGFQVDRLDQWWEV